ncbi:MAG: Transporter [Myxococcaceae bacterium]|nr:Transporter [Myxococcaceae bacterium]
MRCGAATVLPLLLAAACGSASSSAIAVSPRADATRDGADGSGASTADGPSTSSTTSASPSAAALDAAPILVATHAWSTVTRSPWPLEPDRDPREAALANACGADDGALARVARELVDLRARGLGTPDAETLVAKLRAAGQPYVRPRVIVASGQAPIDDTKLKSELARRTDTRAPVRCGVAIAGTPHGGEVLLALRVEALADLAPLPTRARTGEWLSFEARLHVAARSAKLVVLGPRGAPKTVPTSLDPVTGISRARFVLDQPGAFTVQLVGDVAEGPRPLLEARIFADVTPSTPGEEPPAPGEEQAGTVVDPSGDAPALARMIGALRTSEGFPALVRDEKLDALARAHAERMRDQKAVAHDLGDGDFKERFEAEGSLDARAVGENVAHAPTLALAHRALHASPSHRINLLRGDYTHLGVGVARAPDGSFYVCETFAATTRRAAR